MDDGQEEWRAVLGFRPRDEVTDDAIGSAYRRLARLAHPDRGGSDAKMRDLIAARDGATAWLARQAPRWRAIVRNDLPVRTAGWIISARVPGSYELDTESKRAKDANRLAMFPWPVASDGTALPWDDMVEIAFDATGRPVGVRVRAPEIQAAVHVDGFPPEIVA